MKYTVLIVMLGIMNTFMGCSLFSKNNADKDTEQYSTERRVMEQEAQKRLAIARQQYNNQRYDDAKASIKKMRKDCYLALDARKMGILLMDSIELRKAQLDLQKVDSMMQKGSAQNPEIFKKACQKVQFFERKLQYDKQSEIENKEKRK